MVLGLSILYLTYSAQCDRVTVYYLAVTMEKITFGIARHI